MLWSNPITPASMLSLCDSKIEYDETLKGCAKYRFDESPTCLYFIFFCKIICFN